MDLFLAFVNAGTCGLISITLISAILSPRVDDGVVIKIGLIGMALGFGSLSLRLLEQMNRLECDPNWQRSVLLINCGLATVVIGFLLKQVRMHHPLRRVSDWWSSSKGDSHADNG